MTNTLLRDAKKLAAQTGILKQETHQEVIIRIKEQLSEYIANNHCPILTEMILTNYSHPLSLTPADAAKVILSHAQEPIWSELPIPDDFAKDLNYGTRVSSGLWNIISIEFTNVYRTNIFFAPAHPKILGFEIVIYRIDSRMYNNFHRDLPRDVAVDIMSRDPKILSDS